MNDNTKTVTDRVRAEIEARLGREMSPQGLAVLDAVDEAIRDGIDLPAFRQFLEQIAELVRAEINGTVTNGEAVAALRGVMKAMERGDHFSDAVNRHVAPVIHPQQVSL
jgi:hypothetical protein